MEQQRGSETIDESLDLDLGPVDVVLGIITLPLLFWATLYAVSGHERIYATREARLRLYRFLLAIEVVIVAGVLLVVLR